MIASVATVVVTVDFPPGERPCTAEITPAYGTRGDITLRWDAREAGHGRTRGGHVTVLHLPSDAGRAHVLHLNQLLREHRITVTDSTGRVLHDAMYVDPRPHGQPTITGVTP